MRKRSSGNGKMRRRIPGARAPLILASILCSIVFSPESQAASAAAKKLASTKKAGLSIRVAKEDWGDAKDDEVEAILYSVADELMTRVPKRITQPIVVSYSNKGPMALYERGSNGEYRVHLSAKGRQWAHYVYEFAHELCHIMSNYEENAGADTRKYNQWFEETLCETASLFVLRSMAERLAEEGDRSAEIAASLRAFADRLIAERHRQLPPETSLAAWVTENEASMRTNPYLREKNEAVANLLLPLFERDPGQWGSLNYLNLERPDARTALGSYLESWYDNAPADHRAFIADLLGLLGVKETLGGTSVEAAGVPALTAGAAGPASAQHETLGSAPTH